ncbi:MAG: cytidine deaminase [Bryocella sp.]
MSETASSSGISENVIAELRAQAEQAAANSYSPYSHFRVGAAVLLDDGRIFSGPNVENASYRLTICAENTAIAKAISEVGPKIKLRAVAVANLNGAASMPCGACRQILLEFGSPATWVFGPGESGPVEIQLGDLIPHGFHLIQE